MGHFALVRFLHHGLELVSIPNGHVIVGLLCWCTLPMETHIRQVFVSARQGFRVVKDAFS